MEHFWQIWAPPPSERSRPILAKKIFLDHRDNRSSSSIKSGTSSNLTNRAVSIIEIRIMLGIVSKIGQKLKFQKADLKNKIQQKIGLWNRELSWWETSRLSVLQNFASKSWICHFSWRRLGEKLKFFKNFDNFFSKKFENFEKNFKNFRKLIFLAVHKFDAIFLDFDF